MFVSIFVFTFFVSFFSQKILLNEDTETNPGPRHNCNNHFTICHWNLNNISVHTFAKEQLLKANLAVYKFDIVYLSLTYLNASFLSDGDNLGIPGYIMVRADHAANTGGAHMYCKNCLPLNILVVDKLCSFIPLYRSPNQSYDNFVSFLDNLNKL